MGALVRKNGQSGMYVLSNNHVLAACNHVPVGMPILAPSTIDGRQGMAPREVCQHAEICELRSGVPTLVEPVREDAALARVANPDVVSSWQGGEDDGYDTPTSVVSPASGMRVKKAGRSTGLTTGTVEALLNPFPLPYQARYFKATVWFQDVWTVRGDAGESFAIPGDSGSLVVTEDGTAAVGLIFAVGPKSEYGIMVPMPHISGLFGGITLVGNHGV